ncbi:SDR family NAD(P)-dependent oxidoreductase [Bacteroidota bacterium]
MTDKKEIVWITGASTGIGKEITAQFLKNGINVAASSRFKNSLEKLEQEFSDYSDQLNVYPLDISEKEQVKEVYQEINKKYFVYGLINCAGITSFSKVLEDSEDLIKKIVETNLLGSIYAIKNVLPKMISRKGIIINIISVAAVKVFEQSSAYSASKAGLMTYTNVLREELRDKNVKILNILPGATRTPIWPNETLEKFSDKMMSPADVAEFIFNLFSIDSNLVPEEVVIRPISGDL